MISVQEALALIAEQAHFRTAEKVPLRRVAGRRLAVDLIADLDSPPFDKCMMDGFAVRAGDISPNARMKVIGNQFAGDSSELKVSPGLAVRVTTGAPLPNGADSVIVVELSDIESNDGEEHVRFKLDSVSVGKNTMPRGQSMKSGDVVFRRGHLFRPSDAGLLAETGHTEVPVFSLPDVAVLATGNELVSCSSVPGPSAIRNSNGPMLVSCCEALSASVKDLGIAIDDREALTALVGQGLQTGVLIMSGGVSAGQADLVPEVLSRLGVRKIFHKVSIKPGKPLWFGVAQNDSGSCLVFGLPGNPVSTLVCFEIFVRFALELMTGASPDTAFATQTGILARRHPVKGDRPTWWPCVHQINAKGVSEITPLEWLGSSDMRCLAQANALACFQPNHEEYPAGTQVPWRKLGIC